MSLNPIAALLIAGLLALAIKNNQEHQLVALLSDEGGFIKWMVALGVILWLYANAPTDVRVVIGGLLGLTAVTMILQSNEAIKQLSDLVK